TAAKTHDRKRPPVQRPPSPLRSQAIPCSSEDAQRRGGPNQSVEPSAEPPIAPSQPLPCYRPRTSKPSLRNNPGLLHPDSVGRNSAGHSHSEREGASPSPRACSIS